MKASIKNFLISMIIVFSLNANATFLSSDSKVFQIVNNQNNSLLSLEENNFNNKKWEIKTLIPKNDNVKLIESFDGENEIQKLNDLLSFNNEKYFLFKLNPNQSIELIFQWINYGYKKETFYLTAEEEVADFNLNITSEDNINVELKNNGIIIKNQNKNSVEAYLGFEHGFRDVNIVIGDKNKRIEYVYNQKNLIKNYIFNDNVKEILKYVSIVGLLFLFLCLLVILNKKIKQMHNPRNIKETKLIT